MPNGSNSDDCRSMRADDEVVHSSREALEMLLDLARELAQEKQYRGCVLRARTTAASAKLGGHADLEVQALLTATRCEILEGRSADAVDSLTVLVQSLPPPLEGSTRTDSPQYLTALVDALTAPS